MLVLFLLKATKHGKFQRPLSLKPFIGHQARSFPIGFQALDSFQGPSSLEPSIGHQVQVFPHLLPSPSF